MAEFSYQGRNAEGRLVTGTIESASRRSVLQQLQRQKIVATRIVTGGAKQGFLDKISRRLSLSKLWQQTTLSLDEIIMFCRQMHALTRSGIPLIRALNGLSEATRSPLLADILRDVVRSLTQGNPLSSALRGYEKIFSDVFVAMIRMGEATGRLDAAFKPLVDHFELEKDTRKRIASATRYPLIVITFITLALVVINLYVIPEFASLFASLGSELPLATRILMLTSSFMVTYWWWLVSLVAMLILGFTYWKQTPRGRLIWHRLVLHVPVLGPVFERIALARFARPLAMMLEAGVPLLQALTVASRTVGNDYIGQGIEGMLQGIERGESLLATATGSRLFNPLILQMIAVGEETGNISDLLLDVADFYDQEIEYDLRRLAEALEPILLVFMGVMVLILALGIFLPMWELGAAYR